MDRELPLCRLPIAHGLLLIAECLLLAADCLLTTATAFEGGGIAGALRNHGSSGQYVASERERKNAVILEIGRAKRECY